MNLNQIDQVISSPNPTETWPKWRVRLARLSPYTFDIEEQLERLRRLTIALTIVPSFMATIVFVLFFVFGRPDVGALAVSIIFGPMIALAWWDYLRIAGHVKTFLESASKTTTVENSSASNV